MRVVTLYTTTQCAYCVAAKRLLDEAYNIPDDSRGLLLEEEVQRTLLGSPNQVEAVQANMAKRVAEFTDPD